VLVLKTYSRPNPLGVVAPQLVGISDDSSKIEAMLNTTHSMKFYTLCTITAMTLLLVGTLGKIKGAPRTLDRRKAALGNNSTKNYGVDVGTMSTAQRILGRILGVGLPIYAAGLLGGDRVAMIIFTALAGGVLNVDGKGEDLTRLGSMKRVFMQKKWTFAAMLAQIIADFVGLRGFLAPTALIGYLALICSIFAFPPPYSTSTPKLSAISQPRPSSEEKTSTVSTPWEPLKSGVPTTASGYLSPLIATQQDVDLPLFTGGLMFFLSLVIVLLTSISDAGITYSSTGYSMLVAQTMAISLTTINIKSLKTQQKIGVGTGLVLPLLLNPLFQSPPWTVISCQAVLAISSWVGVKADTMSAFRRSKQFHRRRADSYLATKKVAQHSRVTGILLKATDDWPLLHSILVEKDSRRIFYFMWYVYLTGYSEDY
jgi:zinc transporter 5/7